MTRHREDAHLLFCIGVLSIVAPMAGVLTAFVLLVQGRWGRALAMASCTVLGVAVAIQ